MNKDSLLTAISDLMQHPNYHDRHSFWDCTCATLEMSIFDFTEIVNILKPYTPPGRHFKNKVAILLEGEMNKAIMTFFISWTKMLPFNFQVFTKRDDLITFIHKG